MSLTDYEEIVDPSTVRGDRDDDRWSPLKISCQVNTPVIDWGDGFYLDGPLSWAMYVEWCLKDGPELDDPNTLDWIVDFALPVAKWEAEPITPVDCDDRLLTPDGNLWGWCVSRAIIGESLQRKMAIRGSTPTEKYKRYTNATTVKTATGPDKPVDKIYPTTVTNRLTWYALGDAEEVARLLERVTSIGARRNVGFGEIRVDKCGVGQWGVEETEEDRSISWDGRMMRRMPYGDDGIARPARMMSVRAPYWHPCRRHLLMEADR